MDVQASILVRKSSDSVAWASKWDLVNVSAIPLS
jgi:hypothetical protein